MVVDRYEKLEGCLKILTPAEAGLFVASGCERVRPYSRCLLETDQRPEFELGMRADKGLWNRVMNGTELTSEIYESVLSFLDGVFEEDEEDEPQDLLYHLPYDAFCVIESFRASQAIRTVTETR